VSVAKRLLISGRVQGVFYRASTRDSAVGIGVGGWVRNLPDGRVEAWAQGTADQVQRLVAWCHQGPEYARVDEIEQLDVDVDPDLAGRPFSARY
jgi:acylphosphatase